MRFIQKESEVNYYFADMSQIIEPNSNKENFNHSNSR